MERPLSIITTQEELARILPRLEAADSLAVDTEADSLYRYAERVCLVQLSTRAEDFILDPLALKDLSALRPVYAAKELIFHAADYDINGLARDFGLRATRVFDTLLATWLLEGGQISLANLVEARLKITLSKAHQKDDWGRRPLPPSMLDYAREDTRHLHALADQLRPALAARGLDDAAEEEFARLCQKEPRRASFDPEGWSGLKGALDLAPAAYPALRALYLWRDEEARRRDLPPFKVLQNSELFLLAERRPKSPVEVQRLRLPVGAVSRYASLWVRLIAEAPAVSLPPPPPSRPRPSPEERALLDKLRAWRDTTAAALQLDSTVVSNTAFLEQIVRQKPRSLDDLSALPDARAWRIRRFGAQLLALVA